jgi:photosystem II stability/assembly factor-like uncharacterized protein
MKKLPLFLIVIFSFLLLTGQGCISVKNSTTTTGTSNAGIWVSSDKAETWLQKDLMPTVNGLSKLGTNNVDFIVFDPQDYEAVYWGAGEAGLYLSHDGMKSWQENRRLPKAKINDLAVDPRAQNIIYLSIGNRMYKTTDCCSDWRDIYIDLPGVAINSLAVDPSNSSRILAGLADGRLLETRDAGTNWSALNDFKTTIKEILFNPRKPQIVYVGTNSEGLYKSVNGGASWTKDENLAKINGAKNYKYGFFDLTREDGLYLLTDAGFLRSEENTIGWKEYKLLTPPGKVKVLAFAANPFDPNEIYYATDTTFYKSSNAGQTWVTKDLPTDSLPVYLTVHPANQNMVIMGMQQPPKKK